MLESVVWDPSDFAWGAVGHASAMDRSPVELFGEIFMVFLVLGTLVGVVVIGYMLYNAWHYRDGAGNGSEADVKRPQLGEKPSGSGGGKKLFLSFGLSAIIVLGLIVWTYQALLFVEGAPDQAEGELEIDVTGHQYSWSFEYPNGHTNSTLRVPKDRMVNLNVTSADVMHTIGIPEFRVKADALPGQTTSRWFQAEKTGTFRANCYELCGRGHSNMSAAVIVMEPDAYQEWYNGTEGDTGSDGGSNESGASGSDGGSHAIRGAVGGGA